MHHARKRIGPMGADEAVWVVLGRQKQKFGAALVAQQGQHRLQRFAGGPLAGGIAIMVAYGVLLNWGIRVGLQTQTLFGRMLAVGLSMTIFFYVLINSMRSLVQAVPKVATALGKPSWASATTSI